jgi:hypothetical protein
VATEPVERHSNRLRGIGVPFLAVALMLAPRRDDPDPGGRRSAQRDRHRHRVAASLALVVGAGLLVWSLVGGRMAKGKPFA